VSGREFLAQQMESIRPLARRVVRDHLTLIERLDQQIVALEADLQLNEEHKQTLKLLKSMPGIGQITGTVILAEIGDTSALGALVQVSTASTHPKRSAIELV